MTSVTSVPAEEAPRAPLNRLPSLTGLRWVAAFMVFGFHVGTLNLIQPDIWHRRWDHVFGLGASGVSFFFVLSGFVLAWSARPGDSRRAFWWRRIIKIYPNHLVTWFAVLMIMVAWGDKINIKPVLANLALLQTWTWKENYPYSVNSVSWTLCCEMFFYLLMPFALPLLRKFRTGWLAALVIALPILILLVSVPVSGLIPGTDQPILGSVFPLTQHIPPDHHWWFTQMFPPVRSLEFFCGAIAGVLMTRGSWRGPGLGISTALFVVVYATCRAWVPAEYHVGTLTAAYVLLIAGAARADLAGTPSLWRKPVMVWLGEVSFAFYLVHVALAQTVLRLLERNGKGWDPIPALGVIALAAAGSLLLAWMLFRFVEKPAMRFLGRWKPGRRREPATGETRSEQDARPADARPAEARPAGAPPADPPGGP